MVATAEHDDATELTDRQFEKLCGIAKSQAGLTIAASKRQMIQSRISRHLRDMGRSNMDDYLNEVATDNDGAITSDLISVLTTNVSSFFREKHHFETFERDLLPNMIQNARAGGKIRIWSAGCSSGQEPYSLAMMLLKRIPDISRLDFKILGTDIDRKIIQRAQTARYSDDEARTLPCGDKKKFFVDSGDATRNHEVVDQVRDLVSIRPLNLLQNWPMKNQFDAIFCRNVLIYFDAETQSSLWPRFSSALSAGGYLFLGHSERIQSPELFGFSACGVTTYQKIRQPDHQPFLKG